MKIKKFIQYLNETYSIVDIAQYEGIEKALIEILYKNVENGDSIKMKQFITKLEKENITDSIIFGLSSDQEWFNFYLKFKDEIDVLLTNINYFDKSFSEKSIFSLYSIVIDGCQIAVMEKLKDIKNTF